VPAEQIADITARFMDQIQDDGDVDDCDDEDGEGEFEGDEGERQK
jgi:hypothetical protein|tara:strand:+ start:303 stop:437 length:135 start_codon:yes stop_codon:yes gene_type:complete